MALDNSYLFPFITRVHHSIIVLVKFRAWAAGEAGVGGAGPPPTHFLKQIK